MHDDMAGFHEIQDAVAMDQLAAANALANRQRVRCQTDGATAATSEGESGTSRAL